MEWLEEEMEWEGEDWAWEEDMPVPINQTWWFDLTLEG